MNEKALRLRYVRALEKFINSHISYLRSNDFDMEILKKKVAKTYEILAKVQAVRLDSPYTFALECYANSIIHILNMQQIDALHVRDELIKGANLLQKEKNKNRYKKDKHSKASFNDGY
ncbi:MAG: hypothetical protein IBX44_05815 [Sulfurospirillum sp.]|nr:hypothetical protein [Sulfurospirillum sp.]